MLEATQRLNETPQIQPSAALLGSAEQEQEARLLKARQEGGSRAEQAPKQRRHMPAPLPLCSGLPLTPLATERVQVMIHGVSLPQQRAGRDTKREPERSEHIRTEL